MFSFDMLNIKMILYEQNVTPRLSLIDRNNAKQNYQYSFIGVHSFCNGYNIILCNLQCKRDFLNNKPRSFK